MRKYLVAALMGLLIGTVAFAPSADSWIYDFSDESITADMLETNGTDRDGTKYYRDDGTWQSVAGGSISDNEITGAKLQDGAVDLEGNKITGTLPVASGGTGSDNATGARTNLGLGEVDNTADADKPISTLTQAALDLKAPLSSPTFTGTVTIPGGSIDNATLGLTTAIPSADITSLTRGSVSDDEFSFLDNVSSGIQTQVDAKRALTNLTFSGAPATFDNEVTATQFSTTCSYAENNCFVNVGVSSPPACTAEREMNSVFDNTTGGWVTCRAGEWVSTTATSVHWDNVTDKAVLPLTRDFVIKGYTIAADNTLLLYQVGGVNETLVSLSCITGGSDNATLSLWECGSDGGSCLTTGLTSVATSAGNEDSSPSNAVTDANDWVRLYVDAVEGEATYVSCRVKYTVAMP